jgi:hypothetical protein
MCPEGNRLYRPAEKFKTHGTAVSNVMQRHGRCDSVHSDIVAELPPRGPQYVLISFAGQPGASLSGSNKGLSLPAG